MNIVHVCVSPVLLTPPTTVSDDGMGDISILHGSHMPMASVALKFRKLIKLQDVYNIHIHFTQKLIGHFEMLEHTKQIYEPMLEIRTPDDTTTDARCET